MYPEEWEVSRAKEYLSKYPIPLYTGDDIRIMIARYRDRQLRHRIYQNALKGELNAIIDKARDIWCASIDGRSQEHI